MGGYAAQSGPKAGRSCEVLAQAVDPRAVGVGEREVEDLEVLDAAGVAGRLRDGGDAFWSSSQRRATWPALLPWA